MTDVTYSKQVLRLDNVRRNLHLICMSNVLQRLPLWGGGLLTLPYGATIGTHLCVSCHVVEGGGPLILIKSLVNLIILSTNFLGHQNRNDEISTRANY